MLAQNAKVRRQRDGMSKGFKGRIMLIPGIITPIDYWFRDLRRAKGER